MSKRSSTFFFFFFLFKHTFFLTILYYTIYNDFIRQTKFASLPEVLVVHAKKFQLVNWVPAKLGACSFFLPFFKKIYSLFYLLFFFFFSSRQISLLSCHQRTNLSSQIDILVKGYKLTKRSYPTKVQVSRVFGFFFFLLSWGLSFWFMRFSFVSSSL